MLADTREAENTVDPQDSGHAASLLYLVRRHISPRRKAHLINIWELHRLVRCHSLCGIAGQILNEEDSFLPIDIICAEISSRGGRREKDGFMHHRLSRTDT